jgi:bacillopeptidase F
MPGRYRQTHNNKRSRFYILLSIVFVVVMAKWGIPLFVNLVAGTGAQRISTGKDIIPPQTPIISALPDATNSAGIIIEGYTEVGATVDLLLNDVLNKQIKADANGYFSFSTLLASGQNRIQVKAQDEAGNESSSEVSLITLDTKPVDLVIASPKDGTEYIGSINQVVDITGSVSKPESQVLINNSFTIVDKDGNFDHRFMLSNGDNNITISATDNAGNTSAKTIKLTYTP